MEHNIEAAVTHQYSIINTAQDAKEKALLEKIVLGGVYQHSKNKKFYKVIHIGRSSEDCSLQVIYQALYTSHFGDNIIWTRSLQEFLDQRLLDGKVVDRFIYIKKAA